MSIITKKKVSLKAQTLAALLACASAVEFPRILHLIGLSSGLGSGLGEVFLPMHLPIILVGFLVGPYAACIAGVIAPVISFLLTGMPNLVLLPFMVIELFCYGISSGFLKNISMPNALKVVITQLFGRAVRAISIVLSVFVLGYEKIDPAIIWTSISKGLFGIILQIVMIPLILYRIEEHSYDK